MEEFKFYIFKTEQDLDRFIKHYNKIKPQIFLSTNLIWDKYDSDLCLRCTEDKIIGWSNISTYKGNYNLNESDFTLYKNKKINK